MNVLAIAGSLRRGSCNGRLLRAAVNCAPAGLTMRVYEELAAIPLFNQDLEHPPPESVRELRRLVRESDGVLFATPEYNQSIPGVLKNAIDWLSRPPEEVLSGKSVAIIGASTGRWGTRLGQSALRQVLYATESRLLPTPSLFLSHADDLFDANGTLMDGRTQEQLRAVLTAFAAWIRLAAGEGIEAGRATGTR
jgi:chromate reductase